MALLFDTSAVIGLIERQSVALRELAARDNAGLAVSTMTLGELERGARQLGSSLAAHTLDVAATTMEHVEIDPHVGPACFGHIAASSSRRVGGIDCWIATTAVLGRFDLVTQDRSLAEHIESVDWEPTAWAAPRVTLIEVGS